MLPAPEAVRMKVEKRVKKVKGCICGFGCFKKKKQEMRNGRMKKSVLKRE